MLATAFASRLALNRVLFIMTENILFSEDSFSTIRTFELSVFLNETLLSPLPLGNSVDAIRRAPGRTNFEKMPDAVIFHIFINFSGTFDGNHSPTILAAVVGRPKILI